MNIEEVKELLEQFDQSSLTEFNFRKETFDLYMNKNTTSHHRPLPVKEENSNSALNGFNSEGSQKVGIVEEATIHSSEEKKESKKVSAENVEEIVSPIVGIVYLKPAPDKEDFKKVGDAVKKGEVICIIEAMKLMNEITSTVDGVITEILVANEEIVEYNQPLITVAKGV